MTVALGFLRLSLSVELFSAVASGLTGGPLSELPAGMTTQH